MRVPSMLCFALVSSSFVAAQQEVAAEAAPAASVKSAGDELPGIADFVASFEHRPGFVDLYLDAARDRLFLRIEAFGMPLLYVTANATGLGANEVGLDRGSLGPQRVVRFRRAGRRVLVLADNLGFRSGSGDADAQRAVDESFAPATIGALPIVAVAGEGQPATAVLVDATAWFSRDATGAAARLGGGKGGYRVDAERSAMWPERSRAFPDNTEVEVMLTFVSEKGRGEVASAAVDAKAVTLRQHHSLIRLPDDGYQPREADPRVGYFGPTFQDHTAPLDGALHRRYIARHRLKKQVRGAAVSEPVEPIVYYVDPATPEPVRSALIEGASWWRDAFHDAGFDNAFRVELLPDGADPMDVRYNMIHWVHRRTRGWSYGASIVDPRTGEILKGNVLLGSLRVRQDHLKFIGLQSPFEGDKGAFGGCAAGASPGAGHLIVGDDELAQQVALMRIRQLAAHEVGHTLGLTHNFAASSYGRASVMDYPAPLVSIEGEQLDFSAAYSVGVGAYDRWAIQYGYLEARPGEDERTMLDEVLRAGLRQGMVLLTDQDARGVGTCQPLASLWDNGVDPVAQLEHEIRVRAIALRRFGVGALRPGTSLAMLEDALVPLYLHHRYQLEAAVKVIGGVDFRHAVGGDGQVANLVVPLDQQRRALDVVLGTLQPQFLQLDPRLLQRIPPAAPGHPSTAERFPRSTGQPLDPVAMASVAADLTISALLHHERAARLLHRGDGDGMTLRDVVGRLVAVVFGGSDDELRPWSVLERAVQNVLVDRLMDLASQERAGAGVRAVADGFLEQLAAQLERRSADAAASPEAQQDVAWGELVRDRAIVRRIRTFLASRDRPLRRTPTLATPPGSPIGAGVVR